MRKIIEWVSALLAVALLTLVPLAPTATAAVVDASKDNKGLPTTFDDSLLKGKAIAGHEDNLQTEANRIWSKCLDTISYARQGSGPLGVSNKIYVGSDGYCHTPQFTGWRTSDMVSATYYDISNIDVTKLQKEILGYLDFVAPSKEANVSAEKVQEKAKEAEKNLAGDEAYDAAKRNGGGKVAANTAEQTARAAVSAGASVEQVEAVTNPSGGLDDLLNKLKSDSGKAITQGVGYLSKGTSFNGADENFRSAYGAAAGVGLVLLAIGSVISLARLRNEGLPMTEVVLNWGNALVRGVFGLLFTPVFLYVCTTVSDALTAGVLTWMGKDGNALTGSLIDPFNALTTANSPLGWLGAFVICLLFFIAGLMLLAVFVVQYLSAYFGAVGLAIGWGFVSSKKGWRALKLAAATVVGVVFARPLIMFMLGAATQLSSSEVASADGWSTDPMGTMFRVLIGIGAILLVCFTPAGFLRFIPGVHAGAGTGRGLGAALAGGFAGVSMAASMFGNRMHSMAPRTRSASASAGARASGTPRQGRGAGTRDAGSAAGVGAASAGAGTRDAGSAAGVGAASTGAGTRDAGSAGTKDSGNGRLSPGSSNDPASGGAHAGDSAADRPPTESRRDAGHAGSGGPASGAATPSDSGSGSRAGSARSSSAPVSPATDDSPATPGGSVSTAGGRPGSAADVPAGPGRRLTGRDLMTPSSRARRTAGKAITTTAGAAATTLGVAAVASRTATYQASNFAHHTTREDEDR